MVGGAAVRLAADRHTASCRLAWPFTLLTSLELRVVTPLNKRRLSPPRAKTAGFYFLSMSPVSTASYRLEMEPQLNARCQALRPASPSCRLRSGLFISLYMYSASNVGSTRV